jgi:hypothetical protein
MSLLRRRLAAVFPKLQTVCCFALLARPEPATIQGLQRLLGDASSTGALHFHADVSHLTFRILCDLDTNSSSDTLVFLSVSSVTRAVVAC